nr:ERAP1-like C-terminal domain-containing protein [Chthoniobacterales bacterium]
VWLARDVPRDPTRRIGSAKEAAMESDARSTTHPIQQPVATEAEAGSAFDEITYKKGQSFIRMLESFLGEAAFRDGIRKYTARHKYSNTTTADLWNALGEASGKPVAEIAANWTEQPGFPIVQVRRDPSGKVILEQKRFAVNFPNAPALEWKIPLTYFVSGAEAPVSVLMTSRTMELTDIPLDRAVKFNVEGAGNYRVQYDDLSWKLALAELPQMSVPDRVNLLGDAWALVQANRAPIALYLELVEKLPTKTELAEREQIRTAFDAINSLLGGDPKRAQFQQYARSVLRPSFDEVGWEPKSGEPNRIATLRGTLIEVLGDLNDAEIIAGCRARFEKLIEESDPLAPDLRASVLRVVGRYADEATWNKLHELGLKTISIEEKQDYYAALASTVDPKLMERTLQIALKDELPTSRAVNLVPAMSRQSGHPDIVWQFAKKNMKPLLAKADALAVNHYAPSLFTFFSDPARMAELETYAADNLSPASAKAVAKAKDEIAYRADFRKRLVEQMANWGSTTQPHG